MTSCLKLNDDKKAACPGASDVPEVTSVICRSWRNKKKNLKTHKASFL